MDDLAGPTRAEPLAYLERWLPLPVRKERQPDCQIKSFNYYSLVDPITLVYNNGNIVESPTT